MSRRQDTGSPRGLAHRRGCSNGPRTTRAPATRGELVFKAHSLLYHSTLGLQVTKKNGPRTTRVPATRHRKSCLAYLILMDTTSPKAVTRLQSPGSDWRRMQLKMAPTGGLSNGRCPNAAGSHDDQAVTEGPLSLTHTHPLWHTHTHSLSLALTNTPSLSHTPTPSWPAYKQPHVKCSNNNGLRSSSRRGTISSANT